MFGELTDITTFIIVGVMKYHVLYLNTIFVYLYILRVDIVTIDVHLRHFDFNVCIASAMHGIVISERNKWFAH